MNADLRREQPRSGVLLRDVLISAGLGLLMVVGTYGAARHRQVGRHPDLVAVALLLAVAGSLALRRRRPVEVLASVWVLTLLYFLAGYPYGPVWLGLIIAYFTAVASGHRVAGAVSAVSGFLVFPWIDDLLGRGGVPTPTTLTVLAAALLALFGVAESVRVRRQRIAEAARIRSEAQERRASEERLRIAQELHDVLAHNISLINVQAGVALHVNEGLPEPAREALAAIKQASREALGELRTVLDVLRRNGESAAPRTPAPGLARLPDLVEGARVAGLRTHVEVQGDAVALPASIELAAYRVVQEALTNVIRHAGAANVWVRVRYGHEELGIRVEDDGSGPPAPPGSGPGEGGGNGIPGMRERAAALGGRLDAGPRPGGGFQVVARLPLGAASGSAGEPGP